MFSFIGNCVTYVLFICLLFFPFLYFVCFFIVFQKCSQNLSVELTKYCWQEKKRVLLSFADYLCAFIVYGIK